MIGYRSARVVAAAVASLAVCGFAHAATTTYSFDDTLAADQSGRPSLVAVDPLGKNGFDNATVFGKQRLVYHWDGNRTPINEQAGLTLDTSGLLANKDSYSLELVFEFTEDTGTWRRIFDTTGRMEDTGFYVEPGDRLQVYNDVTGTTTVTTNEFHYVAMTVSNSTVKAYLDGKLELNSPTDKLNIQDPVVSFFVDNNLGGPAQTEFADGRIALIRLSDAVLSEQQISQNAGDPFNVGEPPPPPPPPPGAIPLPGSAAMALPTAAIAGAFFRRFRRKM